MPIVPPSLPDLLDVYDSLTAGAEDLVGAAAQVAPAAVRRVLCQAGGLGSLLGGPLGPLQGPGSINRQLSDLGGILQAACPTPPPLPPQVGPLFTGGQCPQVAYRVRASSGGAPIIYSSTPPGFRPILGPVEIRLPTSGTPPNRVLTIQVRHSLSNGQRTDWISLGSSVTPPFTFLGVQRVDGLPDNCGNPPDVDPPPPGPIPQPPESPVIPDGGGGGGFIFRPTVGPINVGPDGGINIPVVVNIGGPSLNIPITIPVNVGLPDFEPTIVFGGGGGVAPPGGGPVVVVPPTAPTPVCCIAPTVPGPIIVGQPGQPIPSPDTPNRRRIVGVIVTATLNRDLLRATELGQGGGLQNLFVPRLGNLYFTVLAESLGGAPVASPTVDYTIKLQRQYVPAPSDIRVTAFRAVPEQGVTFSVQPLYVLAN